MKSRSKVRLGGWLGAALAVGCGHEEPKAPVRPSASAVVTGLPPGPTDPLGPRPELAEPAAFTPPVPTSYKRENGMTVWLLERHTLPIVSIQVVLPAGASSDPDGKAGLAWATANMLDEGAGKRGPLEMAREIDRLGASLQTGAYADYGFVQLTVLKKNLDPAATLFGDVIARPQLLSSEFKRVHDLWQNQLKARQSEPDAVASVVLSRKVFPPGHPYAHPTDGLVATASRIGLDDVKKFYATAWRPERAVCVVVGDIDRKELDPLLDRALTGWKPAPPAPTEKGPTAMPGPSPATSSGAAGKILLVDRPDAPQSVIAVARQGASAFDEDSPLLGRVNGALGGSFTSRLNQDLREEHGWSYGARSRFSFNRGRGLFVAQAAVHTEHTAEALQAMMQDVGGMARDGLNDDEVAKTKQLARADLVEAFESVSSAAARLGRNAGIGQTPDREAIASRIAQRGDKNDLKKLAAQYLDLREAVVVIVGPRAKIEPQLKANPTLAKTPIEMVGPEGE